jgi:hypothetical protein
MIFSEQYHWFRRAASQEAECGGTPQGPCFAYRDPPFTSSSHLLKATGSELKLRFAKSMSKWSLHAMELLVFLGN